MPEYTRTLYPMECDYNGFMSPALVLRQSLDYILEDIKRDGCDKSILYPTHEAVWMISRMRFEQKMQIGMWDEVVFKTFPRVIENGRYIFYVEVHKNGELALWLDTAFMAVKVKERRTVPLEDIEPMWKTPPRQAESKHLARMKEMDCPFVPGGRHTVRFSDCDSNRHLTSPGYLALVCDELGYWGKSAHLMRFMQVDYASEVLPGTEIRFEVGRDGDKIDLHGYKPDGRLAFSASCIF